MPAVVEAGFGRLPGCVDQRRALFQKGDAEVMRTSLHGNAHSQILVESVVAGWLLDREGLDRLPVEQHQQLMRTRLAQPGYDSLQIAREQDLDLVLAVLGK